MEYKWSSLFLVTTERPPPPPLSMAMAKILYDNEIVYDGGIIMFLFCLQMGLVLLYASNCVGVDGRRRSCQISIRCRTECQYQWETRIDGIWCTEEWELRVAEPSDGKIGKAFFFGFALFFQFFFKCYYCFLFAHWILTFRSFFAIFSSVFENWIVSFFIK